MEQHDAPSEDSHGGSTAARARRVLVTGADTRVRAAAAAQLRAAGLFDVVERDGGASAGAAVVTDLGFWGILSATGSGPYSRAVLAGDPELRALSLVDSSPDGIDLAAATELGIAVCIAPDATADAVADHTLALILACLRQVLHVDAVVRSGRWRPDRLARDLHRATVGAVGRGSHTDAVIERLLAFDCRVMVAQPAGEPGLGALRARGDEVERAPLHALLPQVDVLTLHLEATVEDAPLIGAAELAALRPNAVLVNTADPRLVDDRAVTEALYAGRLGAAALDALPPEPLGRDHHLLDAPNALLTNRLAVETDGATRRRIEESVKNLTALASRRRPHGCVNPEALSSAQFVGE